jgi:DNA-binding transcriptional LysR family regulator
MTPWTRTTRPSIPIDTASTDLKGGGVDVDTALLRAFVAVAEEGNIGRAAEALHLSQQGVSKRVARLESLLGVRVFERGPLGVTLTDAGTRLLPAALNALDAVDAAVAAVGAGTAITVDVMDEHSAAMEFVRVAAERAGGTAFVTTVRSSDETIADRLLGGSADIAFGRASVTPWPSALSRRIVSFEPLGLLVGAEHPMASRENVPMRELARIPLRFPLAGAPHDWVDYLAQLATECGIEIDTAGCSLGFESFTDAPARDGELATFFGLGMRAPRDPRVRVIPIVDPVPVFPWAVAWRRRWPVAVVEELVGDAALVLPQNAWMPAADRLWWTKSGA